MARLMRYKDATYIREATDAERYESIQEGGEGAIEVDGEDVYVEPEADDDEFFDAYQRVVRRRGQ